MRVLITLLCAVCWTSVASAQWVTYFTPVPVVSYFTPAPVVTYQAAPVVTYQAAPVVTYQMPIQQRVITYRAAPRRYVAPRRYTRRYAYPVQPIALPYFGNPLAGG